MLSQPKSHDGVGQRCVYRFSGGVWTHPASDVMLPYRGRFPMQRIKPALTEA